MLISEVELREYRKAMLERYRPGSMERHVVELHWEGKAPSEIDKAMNLEAGTAHDIVVGAWE